MTGQRPSSSTPTATTSGSGTTPRASRPASSTASTPRTASNTCSSSAANQEPLTRTAPNPQIAGRMYQLEAIKRVVERFAAKHRKALIVQATGTGKTRVAVSLVRRPAPAGWAKRILFLCDRKELRKQAHNVFKEYLPGEPRTFVTAATSKDRDKRIYLATYPAMMECFETFDVGFFDLIIADESHRSIYNRYRDLFAYFDCLQVGLTATPVEFIARNTYKIFGCEDRDPTAYFSFEEAISHGRPTSSRSRSSRTPRRSCARGSSIRRCPPEQRQQLEEDEAIPPPSSTTRPRSTRPSSTRTPTGSSSAT